MDHEALKEQWSEVEDRDGIRLSWNVFPSSRMVYQGSRESERPDCLRILGSFTTCRSYWCSLHTSQGEARHSPSPI